MAQQTTPVEVPMVSQQGQQSYSEDCAILASQASVGFLSHGGPLAVSCSTFETPTKTSPATKRRWSPARSLSQASNGGSASGSNRSWRSSSFPLGQPDPPTPEAIDATPDSQVQREYPESLTRVCRRSIGSQKMSRRRRRFGFGHQAYLQLRTPSRASSSHVVAA